MQRFDNALDELERYIYHRLQPDCPDLKQLPQEEIKKRLSIYCDSGTNEYAEYISVTYDMPVTVTNKETGIVTASFTPKKLQS